MQLACSFMYAIRHTQRSMQLRKEHENFEIANSRHSLPKRAKTWSQTRASDYSQLPEWSNTERASCERSRTLTLAALQLIAVLLYWGAKEKKAREGIRARYVSSAFCRIICLVKRAKPRANGRAGVFACVCVRAVPGTGPAAFSDRSAKRIRSGAGMGCPAPAGAQGRMKTLIKRCDSRRKIHGEEEFSLLCVHVCIPSRTTTDTMREEGLVEGVPYVGPRRYGARQPSGTQRRRNRNRDGQRVRGKNVTGLARAAYGGYKGDLMN